MAQHDVADDVQVTGATLHAVFLDGELAFLAFCLVQVKLWLHLEDVVTELDADWLGGFFCPCHGSKFDMAGRVYSGVPAAYNLEVPPHHFEGDSVLIVGIDPQEVAA